ncbi:S-layer family protein [Methanobrevibacter sp.]|uniref:beta strand repeat-containing protein n=1 Tax=Methanobrevibacter sp. TaxID=66852 RepID=UPI0026E0E3C8|nr:Ig-like domain repeat protein [Methanobrevibacter sp.]MDO5860807.1 hypothetical protein [Methanobrevibacter sp.]
MLNKKLVVILLFVCLFTISSVSAAENITDDTISINDINDNIISDTNENQDINKINEETILTEDSLNENGTFADLANEISTAGSTLNLTKNYVYDTANDTVFKNGININKEITINGNGFTIDGSKTARIFNITSNNIVLNNLTLINTNILRVNSNDCGGGALFITGSNMTINNCLFASNVAHESTSLHYGGSVIDYGGAAIYSLGVNTTINNCTFRKNTATQSSTIFDFDDPTKLISGAAIYGGGDLLTIKNSTFEENNADNSAVYIFNVANFNINNCIFKSNKYVACGIENSNGIMNNCYFTDNRGTGHVSSASGSSLEVKNSTMNVNNTLFYADYYDSCVICCKQSNFTFIKCNISHHTHMLDYGSSASRYIDGQYNALQTAHSNIHVEDSYFYTYQLGSIYIDSKSAAYLKNNTVVANFIANSGNITSKTSIIILNNSTLTYYINESVVLNASIRDDNGNSIVVNHFKFKENNETLDWDYRKTYSYSGTFYIPDNYDKTQNNATYLKNTTLALGTHYINVEFNDTYKNCNLNNCTIYTAIINIIKHDSKVEITSCDNITYNDTLLVSLNIDNKTNASYVIKNNQGDIIKEGIIDSDNLTIDNLSVGIYTITITNNESDEYYSSNASATFEVKKIASSVEIEDIEDTYCINNVTIKFNITNPTEVSAIITNLDDGTNITLEDIHENIITQKLSPGSYNITVYNKETENYLACNATKEFNVLRLNSKVDIDDISPVTYNSDVIIKFTVENQTVVNVTIRNDENETVFSQIVDNFTITLNDLNAGNYTVVITNLESETTYESNATKEFTVLKADSTVKGDDVTVNYGESAVVNITSENATVISYIIFDDNNTAVASGNATGQIDASSLKAGVYIVNLTTLVDDNHNSVTNSSVITINPANSTVSAEDINVTYGSEITITITSENATEIQYQIIKDGEIIKENTTADTITLNDLAAGTYTLNLTTVVDENHTSTTNTSTITVNPANSTVSAEDINTTYGNEITITITSENATEIQYQIIKSGEIIKENTTADTITLNDLAAGTYTLNLTTVVDENHTSTTNTSTITVNPANSTVSAEDINITYGNNITITLTSENATEIKYQIIKDGEIVLENTTKDIINITGLNAGTYTVNLTTVVDENHTSATNTSSITVNPTNSSVKAADLTVYYGESITVEVICENATGVSYIITDANGNITAEGNATGNITDLTLNAGTYTVNLTTVVDENHIASTNTSAITVLQANSSVSAEDVNATYNNETVIAVTSENATEILYQIIKDGVIVKENTTKDIINITGLPVGTYTLNLTAVVDENHIGSTNTSTVTVNKGDADMFFAIPFELPINSSSTIHVQFIPENLNEGIVSFYLNGEFVKSVNVSDGNVSMIFKQSKVGKYNLTVTFTADNYNTLSRDAVIAVVPIQTSIVLTNKESIYLNEKITLNINLNENITGEVKYYIGNGINGVANLTNGSAVVSYTPNATGEFTVFVIYDGDENYTGSYAMSSFTVLERSATISASPVTTVYNGGKYLTATLKDQSGAAIKGAKITITLNGKTYNRTTNSQGVVKLSTNGIAPKTYTAKIVFAGNDKYLKASKSVKVTVKKATPKMTTKVNTYRAGLKVKTYYVALKTNKNKIMKNSMVTFKVNGKTYSAKTNAKGIATFKVTNLVKRGIYNAVVKYPGNTYYKALTKKIKVTVLK